MKLSTIALLPVAVLCLAPDLSAQTAYTWNGGSGRWLDAPNWSPASVPNASDADVRVDAAPGTASVVTLGYAANSGVGLQIGRLRIDTGDRVEFNDRPNTLTLVDTAFAGAGSIQLDGTLALPFSSGSLRGPKTITGAGRLVLGGVGQRPAIYDRTVNAAIIEGAAAFGQANASNFPVLNSGLIDANLPGLDFDFHGLGGANRSENTGTMRSTNGAKLLFGQGEWLNTGTIRADGPDSLTAFYRGGLIEGGVLTASNGGLLQVGGSFNGSNGGSTFRNLTVNGPSYVLETLLLNGTVTNDGIMTLAPGGRVDTNADNPSYDPALAVTFAGTGQVILDNPNVGGHSSIGYRRTRWNIQGLTIRGRGQVGDDDFNPPFIVNRGTFQADRSGSVLRLRLFGLDNQTNGVLRAQDGGILRLAIGAVLANTGGTIEATSGGRIEANFGRIEGGLIRNTGGFIALSGMTLVNPGTGLRFEGDLTLGGATYQEARLVGDIENFGTLRIAPDAGQGARLWLTELANPSVTLRGGGQLILGDASVLNTGPELWDGLDGAFSVRTFTNIDNTVRGFGRVGNTIYDPWLAIDNRHLIQADVGTKELSMGLYSVTNSSTFRAQNGGRMTIYARAGFTNTGVGKVEAEAGSTVRFLSTTISGGRILSAAAGGTMEFPDSNTARDGVLLGNAGTAIFGESGGTRTFEGLANGGSNFVNAGTIRKVGSGEYLLRTALNSTGTIAVDSGVLRNFGGGTVNANTITVATGADLTFQGAAPYTFEGINTFSGGGMPAIAETTTLLADAATELRTVNFRFFNATLSGPGLLSHSGTLEFFPDTAATISGARLLTLAGATATIAVRFRPLQFTNGASWENRGAVVFQDNPQPRLNGVTGTFFDNTATGVVRGQLVNGGFGIIDIPSRNAGRYEVLTGGGLSFEKPSEWIGGTATIAAGTELRVGSTTLTFSGTANASSGAGFLGLFGTASLAFPTGSRFTAERLFFLDSTGASGPGELQVSADARFHPYSNTSVISGTQVNFLATSTNLVEFNNGTLRLQNAAAFRNAGTLNFRAAVNVELNSGALLENTGTMTATSSGNNPSFGGDNTGLFRTTAASITRYFPSNGNTFTVGWPFDFAGQVYADSGMNLTFDRGGLLNETAKIWPNHPASSITFTGATPVRARGRAIEFSGTGYVNLVGTTLQFEPSSIPGDATSIAAGARVAFHGNNIVRGTGTLSTTGFVFQSGDQIVEAGAVLQTFGTADVSVWNATGRKITFKTGTSFLNGGRFVIQSQVGGTGNPGFVGEANTLFHNQLGGSLVHDNGGTTQFNIDFRNDGELDVRAGRFEFLKTFTGTGGIAASGGGKVTLPLGTASLSQLPNSLRATGVGSEINVALPGGDKTIRLDVDGGRMVAAGGGNMVAAGGLNMVAAGGGNLRLEQGLGMVAAGGGNILSHNGGVMVAAGGGNILSHNGGVMVAAGGGNIRVEGGNMVAAGGGNMVAAGGGNMVAAGGLNRPGFGTNGGAGGGIIAQAGGVLRGNGTFEGAGVIEAGGFLAPGDPLGALTWTGSLEVQSGGTLELEIGGPIAGTEYDRINVSGAFTLQGALSLRFVNGFGATVHPSQTFDVVVAGAPITCPLVGTRVQVLGTNGSFEVQLVNGGMTLRLANYLLAPATFSSFANRYGLTGPDALPTADPNRNGLPNLLEYALGLDPTAPGGSGRAITPGTVTENGITYASFTFTQPTGADLPSDILYVPQRATSLALGDWSSSAADVVLVGSPVAGPGNLQTLTVRSAHPMSASNHEFLRLMVTAP